MQVIVSTVEPGEGSGYAVDGSGDFMEGNDEKQKLACQYTSVCLFRLYFAQEFYSNRKI